MEEGEDLDTTPQDKNSGKQYPLIVAGVSGAAVVASIFTNSEEKKPNTNNERADWC